MDLKSHSLVVGALLFSAAAVCTLPCSTAAALNYERNDVKGREIAIVMMRTPVKGLPVTVGFRGTARRHVRHIYYGTSLWLGWSLDSRPVLMLSGAIGVESAASAFEPYRTYGEVGIGGFFAPSDQVLRDLLAFHLEVGVRLTVRNWDRPHWQVFAGLRPFANFEAVGVCAVTGVNFAFD